FVVLGYRALYAMVVGTEPQVYMLHYAHATLWIVTTQVVIHCEIIDNEVIHTLCGSFCRLAERYSDTYEQCQNKPSHSRSAFSLALATPAAASSRAFTSSALSVLS